MLSELITTDMQAIRFLVMSGFPCASIQVEEKGLIAYAAQVV